MTGSGHQMAMRRLRLAVLFCAPLAAAPAAAVEIDPAIAAYQRVDGVSGGIISVGSDTLNNLMTLWAEGFKSRYPNVSLQIEGKGSATAPPALIAGTCQLGPMSREMKREEVHAFEKKFGYPPLALRVAVDALAIFVHKDNPVRGLTLAELDAAFSSTRRLGAPADLRDWGQLGVTGSSSVVQAVGSDPYALGYTGIGYRTSGVRVLPVGETAADFAEPSYENCIKGRYPLARFLVIYLNKQPGRPLDPATREFIRFIHSRDGQQVVLKDGYYPLPRSVIDQTRAQLER
jgi:phosphate transport system substrate-binding protein